MFHGYINDLVLYYQYVAIKEILFEADIEINLKNL
jgi:hypothetical protein